jgi:hypothetical protein
MVATIGENSENIAGSKLVTLKRRGSVAQALKLRIGDQIEVNDTDVSKFSTSLGIHCERDAGVLVPENIAADADLGT